MNKDIESTIPSSWLPAFLVKKRLLKLSLLLSSGLFLIPKIAAAGIGSAIGKGILGVINSVVVLISYGLLFIIQQISKILFTISGYFVNLAFDLNRTILENNSILESGFKITLSLANLGFVLAIIIIAFMTILRIERYEIKKMLGKLILAAILINFSLAITGVLLDFTGVLTNFFIEKSAGSAAGAGYSASLSWAMGISKLEEPSIGSLVGNAFSDPASGLKAVASLFFSALFTILGVIVMSAIALMIFIRYLFITILLIIMPMAWLFWVTPGMEKYWSQWWEAFFKWTFFMPAVTFFLYLAIVSVSGVKAVIPDASAEVQQNLGFITGGVKAFLEMLVALALMVTGLIAGQKLGIAGAGGAMKFAQGMGRGFTGWKKGGFGKLGENIGKGAAKVTARVPLLRRVAGVASPEVRRQTGKIEAQRLEKGGRIGATIGGKFRGIQATKGAEQIAEDVKTGKTSLEETRRKAGARWRSAVPYLRRQRNKNILALSRLEERGPGGKPTGQLLGKETTREIEEEIPQAELTEVQKGAVKATGRPITRKRTVTERERTPVTERERWQINIIKKTQTERRKPEKTAEEKMTETMTEYLKEKGVKIEEEGEEEKKKEGEKEKGEKKE